jgi:hypothetical protein
MGTQREATVDAHDTRIEQVPVCDAALLRRIDWRIIPIMFLAYFLQFLDKVVLNVSLLVRPTMQMLSCSTQMSWAFKPTWECLGMTFPGWQRPFSLPTASPKFHKVRSLVE